MSYKYTVEVWEPLPPEKITNDGIRIDHHVTQEKVFLRIIDAWNWVLENNIEKYAVYKAECIIDNS